MGGWGGGQKKKQGGFRLEFKIIEKEKKRVREVKGNILVGTKKEELTYEENYGNFNQFVKQYAAVSKWNH